jgi:hypothetical protein
VYDFINQCVGINAWLDEGIYALSGGKIMIQESATAAGCKISMFLFQTFGIVSIWTLIAFCVERCVAIWKPLNVATIFTTLKRKIILLCIFLISCVFGAIIAVAFTYFVHDDESGETVTQCRPRPIQFWEFLTLFVIDFGIYKIMPILVVIILNVVLVYGLNRSNDAIGPLEVTSIRSKRYETKIIINLVLVSAVYVIAMAPYSVLGIFESVGEMNNWAGSDPDYVYLIHQISDLTFTFHYINFSANYLIYTISLPLYRAECKKIFCSLCYRYKERKTGLDIHAMQSQTRF